MATDYRAIARAAALKYGVDPDIFIAQIQQESGFNPSARNAGSGAAGIAQFMPGTASDYGVDPMNPVQALDGAARLMRDLLGMFGGDYSLALAGYNAGPGNVQKHGGIPPFAETQTYVKNILGKSGAAQRQAAPSGRTQEGPMALGFDENGNLVEIADDGSGGDEGPELKVIGGVPYAWDPATRSLEPVSGFKPPAGESPVYKPQGGGLYTDGSGRLGYFEEQVINGPTPGLQRTEERFVRLTAQQEAQMEAERNAPSPPSATETGNLSARWAELGQRAAENQQQYQLDLMRFDVDIAEVARQAAEAERKQQFYEEQSVFYRGVDQQKLSLEKEQMALQQQESARGYSLQLQQLSQERDLTNARMAQEQQQFQAAQGEDARQFDVTTQFNERESARAAETQRQERLQSLAADIGQLAQDPGDRGEFASFALANSGFGAGDAALAGGESLITGESLTPLEQLLRQRQDAMAGPAATPEASRFGLFEDESMLGYSDPENVRMIADRIKASAGNDAERYAAIDQMKRISPSSNTQLTEALNAIGEKDMYQTYQEMLKNQPDGLSLSMGDDGVIDVATSGGVFDQNVGRTGVVDAGAVAAGPRGGGGSGSPGPTTNTAGGGLRNSSGQLDLGASALAGGASVADLNAQLQEAIRAAGNKRMAGGGIVEGGFIAGDAPRGQEGKPNEELILPLPDGKTLVLPLSKVAKGDQKHLRKMAEGGIFAGGVFGDQGDGNTDLADAFIKEALTRAKAGTPFERGALPTPGFGASPGFDPLVANLLNSLQSLERGVPMAYSQYQQERQRPAGVSAGTVGRSR